MIRTAALVLGWFAKTLVLAVFIAVGKLLAAMLIPALVVLAVVVPVYVVVKACKLYVRLNTPAAR